MKYILLGLLMFKRFTVYELRTILSQNFQAICSDSMGSIQTALKKMLAEGLILCEECREKKVLKKYYAVTAAGREDFTNWLRRPIRMEQAKNMELGKLLFMGMVPHKERGELIEEMLAAQKRELLDLERIYALQAESRETGDLEAYYEENEEYGQALLSVCGSKNLKRSILDIHRYELLTLRYHMDILRFHIQWFEALQKE